MPWYYRVKAAINVAAPFLVATQKRNLALLISAILKKQTLCLSELARAYPTPKKRRTLAPKHDLLHRIKRGSGAFWTTSGWTPGRCNWPLLLTPSPAWDLRSF